MIQAANNSAIFLTRHGRLALRPERHHLVSPPTCTDLSNVSGSNQALVFVHQQCDFARCHGQTFTNVSPLDEDGVAIAAVTEELKDAQVGVLVLTICWILQSLLALRH